MASKPTSPGGRSDDRMQCADWLVRCRVLPVDHPAVKPTAQPQDLANTLRDGVVLCELLNKLRPGSVADNEYSQHPQMSLFLYQKNVRTFLRVSKSVFQLKDADLFDTIDLTEINNFWKVIRTLSKLSLCTAVQSTGIAPFTADDKKPSAGINYVNYDSMAQDDEFADDDVYTRPSFQKGDEDVYGRLMDYVRPETAYSPTMQKSQPKSHRDMCISEIIHSEAKYIEVLKMIKDKFMNQLKPVIAPADHSVIFQNVEKLYATHTQFHQNLRKIYDLESSHTIADCFIMSKEGFLVYGDYCSNLLGAQELLNKLCQTSPVVQQLVQECQQAANDSQFRLWELLTVPMQRVLKYHLFLKELIKNTDAADPDRKSLQRALHEIEDLSLFVNEVTRDNEMLQSIRQIEESIAELQLDQGVTLKDYGRMLTDGELKVKSDSSVKPSLRFVFLMDKLLLICKQVGESYRFKAHLALANYELDDTLSAGRTNTGFAMRDTKSKSLYVFTAKTAELRNRWISAINMAKDNVSPRYAHEGGHNFVMASFTSPTICDVCRKLLRGVFYQGYKCRNTNLNAHKECLEKAKEMAETPTLTRPRSDASMNSLSSQSSKLSLLPSGKSVPVFRTQFNPKRMQRAETIVVEPPAVTKHAPALTRAASMSDSDFDSSHIYNNTSDVINYVNELYTHPWYAGDLTRPEAEEKLRTKANGTFLVRVSSTRQEHILSIKSSGTVMHMVINKGSNGLYYFKKSEPFSSVTELIAHYRTHSLAGLFKEVPTCLKTPFSEAANVVEPAQPGVLGYCIAVYDYAARSPNQLTLRQNDRVAIISRAGEARGWWKGRLGSQVGYFPYAYVTEDDQQR